MGLQMVALFHIVTHHSLGPAVLAGFACPLALKLLLGFRMFREACFEALYASRLFLFRLGHIAFDNESIANDARFERAFRLICHTITNPRRSGVSEIPMEMETVHALSMLAL